MDSKLKHLMTEWNYDQAVKLALPIIAEWKKRTVEMARILYVANKHLNKQGVRSDITNNASTSGNIARSLATSCPVAGSVITSSTKGWEDFCIDIGLPVRTANDWLTCYDPDKDLLLTRSEYKEAKQLELDALYQEVEDKRKTDPGYAPTDISLKWNRKQKTWSETKFQRWLQEKNFKPQLIEAPQFISRDAKIQEFGLWNTEFMLDLQQKCQDISHEKAERFADYVAVYKKRMPVGITSRELLRSVIIAEAIIADLPDDSKEMCRKIIGSFLLNDGLHNDSWLDAMKEF